jgi:hypothetical protein
MRTGMAFELQRQCNRLNTVCRSCDAALLAVTPYYRDANLRAKIYSYGRIEDQCWMLWHGKGLCALTPKNIEHPGSA